MTTQSIVCGSCNAAVPYGRLSCPSCGELLASVAGNRRVVAGAVTIKATAVKHGRSGSNGSAARAVSVAPAVPAVPSVLADVPDDEPSFAVAASTHAEPEFAEGLDWDDPDDFEGDDDRNDGAHVAPASTFADPPLSRRAEPAVLMAVAADPLPVAEAAAAPVTSVSSGWASSAPLAASAAIVPAPGAYVPRPPIAIPAGPAAPARSWAGYSDTATGIADATAESAKADDAPTRIAEFVRWLAVAGSTLAAVGFLLPMASSVIGSTGIDYLDRWGLAGPFHFVVVLGLLGVLALALAVDRVPLWIRVGLPGLGLGTLLVGLVWPYLLVSALRAGPGALAILVGAILLGVAGIIALVSDRHGSADRAV